MARYEHLPIYKAALMQVLKANIAASAGCQG